MQHNFVLSGEEFRRLLNNDNFKNFIVTKEITIVPTNRMQFVSDVNNLYDADYVEVVRRINQELMPIGGRRKSKRTKKRKSRKTKKSRRYRK